MESEETRLDPGDHAFIESVEAGVVNPPTVPSFPLFIFFSACIKDLIDFLSGGTAGWLASIFLSIVLWLWMFFKLGFVQKRLIRYFLKRWVAALIVGIIPGINVIIPESALLVLFSHFKEKKIVQELLRLIRKFEIAV